MMTYVGSALGIGSVATLGAAIAGGSAWWLLAWPLYCTLAFCGIIMLDTWWNNYQERHRDL